MALQAKTLVRITGILIFLWLSAVNVAMAEEGEGDSGSTGRFDINQGSVIIDKGGTYTITGSEQTGNTIEVDLKDGGIANITIEGVDILKTRGGGCSFNIIQGTVNLTLAGKDDKLQAGDNCAALQVSENSKLVITEKSTGKLTATGGGKAAGIGGNPKVDAGFITIAGGTVVATGGDEAAGIGGGNERSAGSITISGGTVEATGRDGSAGIGGGKGSSFDFITISGGTVKARGEGIGAGIGGGGAGKGGSITIKGGTVDATGGDFGAGIGGGMSGRDVSITISGGKVTTEGNIGDGVDGSGATGTISGGTIVCKSISPAFTISGGSVHTKENTVMSNGKVMAVVKGSSEKLPANTKVTSIKIGGVMYEWTDVYTDENGMLYLYLQQDQPGSVTVTIGGNEYTANASREYDITNGNVAIKAAGDYAIVGGGTQTGNTITVELGKKEDVANITIDGVNIQTGSCPFDIKQGTVNLTLAGKDNVLKAGSTCAALQVSANSVLVITEKSTGKLTARGGSGGAGIGGGERSHVGSITIAGGTVTATGGFEGAGIGGGNGGGSVGSINISGGTVTAAGESGVGIGWGRIGSGGTINISGGKVMTGNIGNGATGTIKGGTIVCESISPTLSITGGSVHTQDNSVDKDNKGMAVVKGLPKGEKVTPITINEAPYGSNDVYTDDKGQLYLYITKDKAVPVSLTIDNQEYTIYVTLAGLITINDEVSYDKNTHKDKNIRITSGATFTIDAAEASVIDLTIESGGKLLTTQQLEVKGEFTVKPNTIQDKWITFCSPVPLKLLNQNWAAVSDPSGGPSLKSGFTTATDQEWTFEQSIKEDTPYLIKVPQGVVDPELYAQNVTLLVENKIKIDPPSGFDNNLLFCANKSLTEQTLTNIYVLDKYNERQAILLKSNYTLQPFEAYFIASPASPTTPAIESQGEPGKVTSPELRVAPDDIIMPQKLTLKQPNSGKGSFTVKEDKEGQVAYGFALKDAKVTLELKPKTKDGYSIDKSLIKVYETNDPNKAITLNGTESPFTFTMPNAPVTIEVEFMKTLTIIPDKGQVVYKDEEITNYHPTYTVENRTDGDKDLVFEGNLKVVDNKGVNTIVNDNLSAGDKYKIEVKSGVTVERLTDNAADAVATLNGSQVSNGWYTNNSVTVIPPSGFLIKQTSFSSASLSLRDATAGDKYTDMLTFADEGEHTVGYSLKRKATNAVYSGKSITYKLDHSAPAYKITVSKTLATVKLTDIASGLSTCSYIWDGGTEQSVIGFNPGDKEATFTLTGKAGTYTLKLTAIDQVGNTLTEDNIQVELKDHYVPDNGDDNNDNNNGGGNGGGNDGDDNDDDNGGGNGGGNDNDPDPIDPVANEAIQAPAYGIYVENSKLCIEASQPCQVSIYNYQGSAVMIRQIPSGKTRLYELPVGQYIVCLSAPYLPQGKVTQKVRVN